MWKIALALATGFGAALAVTTFLSEDTAKAFVEASADVFLSPKVTGANMESYELEFSPAAEPKEGKVIYNLVKSGKKVVVLVRKDESLILFEVEELFDVEKIKIRPLSPNFANSWSKIFQ